MYQLNRMMYAPAAGGFLGSLLKGAGKLVGGLFKKKGVQAAVTAAGTLAKNPMVQTGAAIAAGTAAGALLEGGGGSSGGSGASGGWGYRRRRGITATELRGYRKVANLIHKEGMVSKRARGRH
jgi:hypothetical protein